MPPDGGRIEVHLYGALRSRAAQQEVSRESVVRLDVHPGNTVGDALRRLSIADGEVSNVFRNGRLAAREDALKPGDRLGVFPDDMATLYKWYFAKQE